MKRPVGVVVSAALLLLGSLFQVFMAFGMALSGALLPMQTAAGTLSGASPAAPIPAWMPAYMYVLSGFCLALAAWGIITVIGLFRLRNWARYSVLVIGGGIALIGLFSALITLLLVFIPIPLPPSSDPSQDPSIQMFMRIVFAVIALGYGVVGGIGVYWLVYFNRKKVRTVFAGAAVEPAGATGAFAATPAELPGTPAALAAALPQPVRSRRPFLISLYAVLNLIGAASCLLMTVLPIPVVIFGVSLYGGQKTTLCLGLAAIQAAVGPGLWRLNEWARRLALAMTLLGAVQCGVYLVRPSLILRYTEEINRTMGLTQPPLPERFQTILMGGSFGFSVLVCLAVAFVLIHYRAAFKLPVAAEPSLPR